MPHTLCSKTMHNNGAGLKAANKLNQLILVSPLAKLSIPRLPKNPDGLGKLAALPCTPDGQKETGSVDSGGR